jgi:osmotically-inducible protein OsmY
MAQPAAPLPRPACEPGEDTRAFRSHLPCPPGSPCARVIDLDLAERVERALRATGYGPLRTVRVSVTDGLVALEGRVGSYYLKQLAQAAVLAVPGAQQVRNGLEVVQPDGACREACDGGENPPNVRA